MWKPLFGRKSPHAVEDDERDVDYSWSLPDMEAAPHGHDATPASRHAPSFQYDEADPYPAGAYTAELVGWRPLDEHRVAWGFRVIPDDDAQPANREPLAYFTGTVYRPDNHLSWLMAALGVVPEVRSAEDLSRAELRPVLREAVRTLDADTLLGRRCRIRVEHVRDDLGNVEARVAHVAPAGWI